MRCVCYPSYTEMMAGGRPPGLFVSHILQCSIYRTSALATFAPRRFLVLKCSVASQAVSAMSIYVNIVVDKCCNGKIISIDFQRRPHFLTEVRSSAENTFEVVSTSPGADSVRVRRWSCVLTVSLLLTNRLMLEVVGHQ